MTQKDMVLEHLKRHGSITSMEAINEYACTRLAACIWKLRHEDGLLITMGLESGVNRFGDPAPTLGITGVVSDG